MRLTSLNHQEYEYVLNSPTKIKLIKCLGEYSTLTPDELSKHTGTSFNYTSKSLRDLKNREVVECINEAHIKHRHYRLTRLGYSIYTEL